ncbi:MAG: VOC family protein [Reichenbachiella sp.]|uniref:VOC family protein n=1 Tax=Reichenbachiella sp. TaxID=2184521 RepID=UPI0032667D8F
MEKPDYQIEGMTMAVTNMEQMLDFYSNTFGIRFKERKMEDFRLYSGVWGGMNLLFCPAELAGNTATQNRHQFDVVVTDLEEVIKITSKYGGSPMGEKNEDEYTWSIGIYDPDKNSILFKQLK